MLRRPRVITLAVPAMLVLIATLSSCASEGDPIEGAATTDTGVPSMTAVVYRSPTCGCCKSYEEYLRSHGYTVESRVTDDMEQVKTEHGIPDTVSSCHTTLLDGYSIEGHVPVEAITELLEERPAVDAIAVPGMPSNSPGMGEPDGRPLHVVSVTDGAVEPFLTVE